VSQVSKRQIELKVTQPSYPDTFEIFAGMKPAAVAETFCYEEEGGFYK
jgi:hypothetical protein